YGLHEVITDAHLDRLAKLALVTGLLLAYCYIVELFTAWYSANPYERAQYFTHRMHGPFAAIYWLMLGLNVVTPQLFWFSRFRCLRSAQSVASRATQSSGTRTLVRMR